jgi:RNA polymerase sigma-70 factor (ECF subfamily)
MVVAGSHAALAELYDRHAAAVYGASFRLLGQRYEAEEVVQETFLALWNRAEQFDPGRGSLRAWLMTIGRNRAIDRLRAAGREPARVSFGTLEADAERRDGPAADIVEGRALVADDEGSDPVRQAELSTLRTGVRGALATLPNVEREALVLAYFEGLTQQEIATRLEWPLGTVKTRTRRALRRLRGVLLPLAGAGEVDGPR